MNQTQMISATILAWALFTITSCNETDTNMHSLATEVPKLSRKAKPVEPIVPKPTLAEVRYGEHERHVFDFWKAESSTPTPLVFVIHGGGWRGGNKERVGRFVNVEQLLAAGIPVVATNYRLVSHASTAGIQPENYRAVLDAGLDFEVYYRWVLQSIRRFYIN
jgi:acetyl esterase/lipase